MEPASNAAFRSRLRPLCAMLGLLPWIGPAAEAQLTPLGAHVLTECAAPGDCLANEFFGAALAVCDFDDDGFADLAVGVPEETVGPNDNAGSVHVYYGSPGGLTSAGEQDFDLDDLALSGGADAGDQWGSAFAAGDFDRDGICDLAVGAPGKSVGAPGNHAGAVVVLFGTAGGLTGSGFRFLSQNHLPSGSPESAEQNDAFGAALAALPNGGLAIGVPREDFIPVLEDDAGLVHLLSSSAPGVALDSVVDRDQSDFAADCPDGNEASDNWGGSLVLGRFGATSSLVAGAQFENVGSISSAGRITVIGSPDTCFDQSTSGVLETAEDGDRFGSALAAGDFDDDGFEDLAIGVPSEDQPSTGDGRAGIVQVLFGSADGLTAIGDQLFGQLQFPLGQGGGDIDDHFGDALAAGDFDGDGFGDLAIGVPDEDVGAVVDAGTAHVLYGSAAGLTTTGSQTFHSDFPASMPDSANTNDALGKALATGDFDGNGTDDLAVGMPGEGLGAQAQAGAVTVLYGLERATDAFGTVRFGSAMTVSEVAGNRIVGIVREGGAVLAASVAHSRTGGSAAPGADFNYTAGVENWTAGDLGVEVTTVQILADTLEEADETIVLQLSDPSAGLALGSPSTLTITIEDDDEGGVVQFQTPVRVFGEESGIAAIVVTRGGGAASNVTVQFATASVTAVSGLDFTATSGTLTFAADETSKLINVPLLDDGIAEPAEVFSITLTNPGGGATLGTFTVCQVVIDDNEIFLDDFETGDTARWSNTIP